MQKHGESLPFKVIASIISFLSIPSAPTQTIPGFSQVQTSYPSHRELPHLLTLLLFKSPIASDFININMTPAHPYLKSTMSISTDAEKAFHKNVTLHDRRHFKKHT